MRWHGRTPLGRSGPAAEIHGLIGVRGVGLRIILMLLVLITHIFTLRHYMHAAHNVNSYFDRTVGRAHQLRNDRGVESFHNSGFEDIRLFLRNHHSQGDAVSVLRVGLLAFHR